MATGRPTQRAPGTPVPRALASPYASTCSEMSGKHQAVLPADQEEIAPLEEFARDEGERLGPLGADRGTCVVDEHEVAIGQQPAPAIAGSRIGPSSRRARAPAASPRGRLHRAGHPATRARRNRSPSGARAPATRRPQPRRPRPSGQSARCPAPPPRRRSVALPPAASRPRAVVAKTMTRRRSANSAWARVGSPPSPTIATIVSPEPASQ